MSFRCGKALSPEEETRLLQVLQAADKKFQQTMNALEQNDSQPQATEATEATIDVMKVLKASVYEDRTKKSLHNN